MNEFAFSVYTAVRACRNGEFLDYGALFSYMDIEGLGPDFQAEAFVAVKALENDLLRRRADEMEARTTHGQPGPQYRRKR